MKTYLNANEYKDDEGNIYREYCGGNGTEAAKKAGFDALHKAREALGVYAANDVVTLSIGKGNWVPEITRVIFNDPATIVFWADGTKTVVKLQNYFSEIYDPEKGLAMAIAKKALGNTGNYYEIFRKYMDEPL